MAPTFVKKFSFLCILLAWTFPPPVVRGALNDAPHWSEHWKNQYTRVQDDDAAAVVRTQVWAITEGVDGYMFFATNDGMCVWDGVRWRCYKNPSNNILRTLFYDSERRRLYSAGVNEFG